jgi:hypothetical protein
MGCSSSRIDASYEEAAMINGENKLYYEGYDVQRLYSEFKKISVDGKVPLKAFKKLSKELPLLYEDKEDIIAFYQQFVHDKHFELKTLATLAVILARGTTSAKVNVLSENWFSGEHVSHEHFDQMLEFMFDLAAVALPKLAPKPDTENNYNVADFDNFLVRAKAGREVSKEAILKAIFEKEPVTKATILAWAQTGENHGWLASRFIRLNLKKAGKRLLHKKRKAEKAEKAEEKPSSEATLEISAGKGGVEVTVTEEHHKRHHDHHEHHENPDHHSKEVVDAA